MDGSFLAVFKLGVIGAEESAFDMFDRRTGSS